MLVLSWQIWDANLTNNSKIGDEFEKSKLSEECSVIPWFWQPLKIGDFIYLVSSSAQLLHAYDLGFGYFEIGDLNFAMPEIRGLLYRFEQNKYNWLPILELSVKFASQICHENINETLDGAYLADFGRDIIHISIWRRVKELSHLLMISCECLVLFSMVIWGLL